MLKNLTRRYKYIGIAFLGAISISTLLAFQLPDNGLVAQIKAKLEKYQEYSRPDKVYVHTDRDVYTTGETMWLKAYQVNGGNHKPQAFSKLVYVELISPGKQMVIRQKLRVDGGYGYAQFTVPDNLSAGTYLLRAYNNWMRNADAEFFYSKSIQIVNPGQAEPANTLQSLNNKLNLQFFPEGGNIVEGLKSRIAFKAVNTAGEGISVSGNILTPNGDTITSFKSFHAGMGAFELQPVSGTRYTAIVRLTDSTSATFALPPALSYGTVMQVENTSSDRLKVTMASNAQQKGYILAQSRGTVYFSEPVDLSARQSVEIPIATIPDGILHITFFDETGNPQCERLSFVNNQQNLRIQVTTAKQTYEPREKVTMDISVTDKQGNPVSANLSMAVTDASLPQTTHGNTILSYLLLTSDLKGHIEQPGFYFSGDAKAGQALDYLLMTQGWRRFVWKDIIGNSFFPEPKFDMEDGLSVSGYLKSATGNNAIPNQLVLLSAPGAMPPFQQQYTDQSGYFYFSGLKFNDEKDLFLQVPSTIDNMPVRVVADTSYDQRFPRYNASLAESFSGLKEYVEKSRKWAKIESIYKAGEPDTMFVAGSTSTEKSKTNPYALVDVAADHSIALDKYNEFPDMTEVLREIVPGVLLQTKKGIVNGMRILDIERKLYFKENPLYFIDGIPVTKAEEVLKLDPGMVETIEVYGRPDKLARFELLGKSGVLAIHTRTHDYYPADAQNLFTIPMRGYVLNREFYVPAYISSSARKPDFRMVAYWNPAVVTDANGKASVSFYNPDNITAYQVQVEGISGEGLPGVTQYKYQVKLPLQSVR